MKSVGDATRLEHGQKKNWKRWRAMGMMTNREAIIFLSKVKQILLMDNSWLESTKTPITESFDMAIEALRGKPEQKTGKWVDNMYCSECGWAHETDHGFIGCADGFNFCPNCGADMREGKG